MWTFTDLGSQASASVVAITLLAAVAVYTLALQRHWPGRIRWVVLPAVFLLFLVVLSLLGGLIFGRARATPADVAATMGLVSGHPYTVEIGRVVDGADGQAAASSNDGVFSSSSVSKVDIQPGSAITIDFESGDSSYLLQVPLSENVTFVRGTPGSDAVVVFTIRDYIVTGDPDFGTLYRTDDATCTWVIDWIVPYRACDKFDITLGTTVAQKRLPSIVRDYAQSVTITVPPDLYNQIRGNP